MNILKTLGAERGITIEQLAHAVQLDRATISKLENGRSKAQAVTLGKLAKFFNVTVTDLAELADTTSTAQRGNLGGIATREAKANKIRTGTNRL